ncbi:MAG: iron uptake porin [Synechococcales cyanobacterium RM1_1_8]|nr:iron uptake porin [Synechococcales cyanobacterium RM1_1_8]
MTSVSQLRDVRPTDWAFQALQSLVERYGCIAGYPDGTFRGSRAMTRFEFAAGLNACLDRVNELIASATADQITAEDLAVLQRLQEEFQAELATLRNRVDALEARTAELEANQFSTTTKLQGEVIFDGGAALGDDADPDFTFGGRARLRLRTSFTGKDELRTRLQAGNIQNYRDRFESGRAPEASLNWDSNTNNDFELNELYYRFPVGKARVYVGTVDLGPDDVPGTVIGPDESLLDFFEYNVLAYDAVPSGAGVAARIPAGPVELSVGYYADTDESATTGASRGFFSGSNTYTGQVAFNPTERISLVGSYARFYSPENSDDIQGNTYGINASFQISPKISLAGWAGWADAEEVSSGDDGDTFIWAATLGFPDLFRKGNYGGISVGGADSDDVSPLGYDADFLAEALYRFQLSDNISIQPSIAYIEELSNGSGESAWIANLRTKFSF